MPALDLVDLVDRVKQQQQHDDKPVENAHDNDHEPTPNTQPNHTPEDGQASESTQEPQEERTPRLSRLEMPSNRSPATHFQSVPSTPSMRTGPPRSLSYVYSHQGSPANSRGNSKHEPGPGFQDFSPDGEDTETSPQFQFRGALEVGSSMSSNDRKGKKRESRFLDEAWNPRKWFHDSPTEERNEMDFDGQGNDDILGDKPGLSRAQSAPQSPTQDKEHNKSGKARWGRLRQLIPQVAAQAQNAPKSSVVTPHAVNITDELITGGLSTLMLRLWVERDEKGHRRIPMLFHRLRIRVSDSLHPLKGHKSVFRIECEYANGAVRWVVYRQLRDFVSLHAHYTISNTYNRNVQDMPEFPKTSLPYFKWLNKEGRERGAEVGPADFARLQREALENYLLDLIRVVMFHPTANRLAGFLEISALSISLAQTGGHQYKAGYLQIEAADHKGGGFGRKGLNWRQKREARWCAVRESYLVVLEEPGELKVWDVFLLDSDFAIERPKRYYRQGLSLLNPESGDHVKEEPTDEKGKKLTVHSDTEHMSLMGTIKGRVSKALRRSNRSRRARTEGNHDEDSDDSGDSHSSVSSQPAPILDPSTNVNPLEPGEDQPEETGGDNDHPWSQKKKKANTNEVSKHTFFVTNSQMRLKLYAKNERQMLQWITGLEKAAASSHYTGTNRFDSFAPIRLNVAAQWLVDGRDYFWNLSRAILLAKETIYIHDWWLSPELQMRRPGKDHYRVDRLLERKAKEGVKIYIIVYQEVSSRTTPTDSNYTKQRMTALHPNIMVQRSPSHFQTGTFYWAHHEKLCVIDQAIAFMGGLDICFGRWDTPQHVLIDDHDEGQSQIWPGKDYSNPRISDFYTLNKPEEDMYDRTKVPRMPWHDVSMQIVGQPARDLARHFVQRWNYLLRIKNHKRVMPFLLPPPEFRPGELTQMGLTGTCEMQICRSAGPWSLGTPARIEHSIQNAYLKAIQMSEHFVYIENQFFITSTVVNDVKVENKIGDALVHRIIRAHRDGTPWKCCIIIPLLPGFSFPVDSSDASAVRIILECQNRTICRGPNSIYSRLRKEGIDPDDYITVFCLRNWGKLRGDVLTTEQVYIHGKVCIVDDRLAIIGSANINERSQRGDRDSEIAAVIRDTDMMDGMMGGKPFRVGRFAHTLRIRLMREHLGVDVDAMYEEDLMANEPVENPLEQEPWDPDTEQQYGKESGVTKVKKSQQRTPAGEILKSAKDTAEQAAHASGEASSEEKNRVVQKLGFSHGTSKANGDKILEEERKTYTRDGKEEPGFASSIVPTLEEKTIAEHRPDALHTQSNDGAAAHLPDGEASEKAKEGGKDAKVDGALYAAPANASKSPQTDDEPPHAPGAVNDATEAERTAVGARDVLRKHLTSKLGNKMWTIPTPRPKVDPNGFEDPVCDDFWKNIWVASAAYNTEIFRKVFHAIPDDMVTTWKQYKEFVVHHERMNKPPRDSATPEAVARAPSETGDEGAPDGGHNEGEPDGEDKADGASTSEKGTKGRRPAKNGIAEPFEKWEREEMEKLLNELNGHLVFYPTRFLEGEDIGNNFLFNADRLLPLPIYD
ncbi:Phospholipase D1 [Marasmius crinis-equi]|uniref:Phospholipase n=1 Tax=Marasmius crinis-equi TaxID=585013 RepID=A0ABR3FN70_9AGAR